GEAADGVCQRRDADELEELLGAEQRADPLGVALDRGRAVPDRLAGQLSERRFSLAQLGPGEMSERLVDSFLAHPLAQQDLACFALRARTADAARDHREDQGLD